MLSDVITAETVSLAHTSHPHSAAIRTRSAMIALWPQSLSLPAPPIRPIRVHLWLILLFAFLSALGVLSGDFAFHSTGACRTLVGIRPHTSSTGSGASRHNKHPVRNGAPAPGNFGACSLVK